LAIVVTIYLSKEKKYFFASRSISSEKENVLPNRISEVIKVVDARSDYFIEEKKKIDMLLNSYSREPDDRDSDASKLITEPSGHIKKMALMIFNESALSTEKRDLVISEILSYHDAKLILPAMLYVKRYFDIQKGGDLLDAKLLEVIKHGSIYCKREVAKNIHFLIDETNLKKYQKLLNELDKNSIVYKNLQYSLKRYR